MCMLYYVFFFKQKTAYEMRISDCSSDVCSSDLVMALFMVMFMMNPAGLNPMWMVHQHRLAAVSGFAVFAALTTAVLLSDLPHDPVAPGKPVIHDLGLELLGE